MMNAGRVSSSASRAEARWYETTPSGASERYLMVTLTYPPEEARTEAVDQALAPRSRWVHAVA
jgi:hypothetical protein